MRITLFSLSFFLSAAAWSQNSYTKVQWQPSPSLHTIDKKYSDAAAVYVLDKKVSEYSIEKDGFLYTAPSTALYTSTTTKALKASTKCTCRLVKAWR